ncbi:unnamed protein product [Heterobilharzia americana]|nr:unnamed protein product [Heterobilharzia americana]
MRPGLYDKAYFGCYYIYYVIYDRVRDWLNPDEIINRQKENEDLLENEEKMGMNSPLPTQNDPVTQNLIISLIHNHRATWEALNAN